MAYLKPPWFVVHVFNPIARLTGIGGSQTLTVTRSSNHVPQRIPVVVPEVAGVKYLVSTRGESAWVKNVRENPVVALGKKNYLASEVPVADRAQRAHQRLLAAHLGDQQQLRPGEVDVRRQQVHPGHRGPRDHVRGGRLAGDHRVVDGALEAVRMDPQPGAQRALC